MILDFIKGARYAIGGFSLVQTKGVRRYVALPLAINVALFTVGIYLAFDLVGGGITMLVEWLPSWLDWLSWLAWLLFGVIMLVLVFYTFTLLANLIGAPFNGILSEKLEEKLTGNMPPSSGRLIETVRGISSAITSEFKKFGYLISRALPLVLISFIPVVNVAAPFLWFGFGAWMLALEYLDYPMGNHGFSFNEQRAAAKQKRRLMLGFGSVIMIMTMIPLLNFLAMPVAVAGATKMWIDVFAESSSNLG
jgi:CysZ protein